MWCVGMDAHEESRGVVMRCPINTVSNGGSILASYLVGLYRYDMYLLEIDGDRRLDHLLFVCRSLFGLRVSCFGFRVVCEVVVVFVPMPRFSTGSTVCTPGFFGFGLRWVVRGTGMLTRDSERGVETRIKVRCNGHFFILDFGFWIFYRFKMFLLVSSHMEHLGCNFCILFLNHFSIIMMKSNKRPYRACPILLRVATLVVVVVVV